MVLRFSWIVGVFGMMAAIISGGEAIASLDKNPKATPQPGQLPEGFYHYGEARERQQVGATYLLLTVEQRGIHGMIYQPNSSYHCFTATLHPDHLALLMVDRTTDDRFTYAIPRVAQTLVASTQTTKPSLALVGYHPIDPVTPEDQNLLMECNPARRLTPEG
ncbi:hypothetical protein VB712_10255 [Spirulina sp. CCNP1310]|uniref:hypothetical protein n=1 Tax=Spirulina sp. CCNP1310 TaxID=3110249 RepID=UPI002B1F1310|nr:hypothetical protein [Spirulina sp. CCNP1310]MEA5419604.1 hypothetical protein [Spirulina sp. CCNP1310]